jgi:Na+/proline symporter
VQRFVCVPTVRDARKSAWLFGVLYLVSPLFWMLPPIVYRLVDPTANAEQAYILAAWSVLPAGMLGLMVAAMFSATASMVSSQLNVFAGVLTEDIIVPLLGRRPEEAKLIRIGRVMTLALGVVITAVALAVPLLGGAEKVVLSITSLIVGPMLLPLVWALFSRKVTTVDLAVTAAVCFSLGLLVRFGLSAGSSLASWPGLATLAAWVQAGPRNVEVVVGVVLPGAMMALAQWRRQVDAPGATALRALATRPQPEAPTASVAELVQPARVVGWGLAACAAGMLLLALNSADDRGLLLICAAIMGAFAVPALRWQPRL